MQLEVECTWNEKRNQAKQIIRFDYSPQGLFAMPNKKVKLLQRLFRKLPELGSSVLSELEVICNHYSNSLYANVIYYQTLDFFDYHAKATLLLEDLQKRFAEGLFVKCLFGSVLLKNKLTEKFLDIFGNNEVIKANYPRRKFFFFEEVLFFHRLWAQYFNLIGDEIKMQKHKNFIFLIMNTWQTFHLAQLGSSKRD